MGRKEDNIKKAQALMTKPTQIRNIGIAAHIDHGKTTLSDNLIAGAGMMSEELAGKQLLLDYDDQEQARGITINAANASMVHEFEGQEYLVNLIDTPGHVDFGGDVTRAMRAVDGSIVVVCAVEGVMPQTETVIRQSLKEKVKPLLFINKVDRLINELEVTPEQMQERFIKIINEELIRLMGGTGQELQLSGRTPFALMLVGLQGSGKTTPTILVIDELENNISYFTHNGNYTKLILRVHPFIASFLTRGTFSSTKRQWSRKFHCRIKIIPDSSYQLLEYHFFNKDDEEILE